ncbi:MAG: hypothetical protein JRI46_11245 [Deltaproteobacteria bacterium]|nr:hypothetical protein [Deltaproteobacteria bacterium]
MKGGVRVRFAPSPTGLLHIGNARTALYNKLFSLKHDGAFVLRIEDTDLVRLDPAAEAAIMEDLHWLGSEWGEGPEDTSLSSCRGRSLGMRRPGQPLQKMGPSRERGFSLP